MSPVFDTLCVYIIVLFTLCVVYIIVLFTLYVGYIVCCLHCVLLTLCVVYIVCCLDCVLFRLCVVYIVCCLHCLLVTLFTIYVVCLLLTTGQICREKKVYFHMDAAQVSFSFLSFDSFLFVEPVWYKLKKSYTNFHYRLSAIAKCHLRFLF